MLDAITLTVLQNRFQQITEEMDVTLDYSAFSPVISEGQDRASGMFTRDLGRLIAQGASGMPIHIGAMQFAVGTVAKLSRRKRPGDIYIINDPYQGGTHLMDVKLIMPVFAGDELFCYLGSSGHWPDTGGSAPGGFVTRAVEIQQEGLRIPPVRLYQEGELDEELLELILSNIRVPEQRLGDLQAQVASLRAGEREVHKMLAEYGAKTLHAAIDELYSRSSRLMREMITGIPPGLYSFEDAMDNDGIVDDFLFIRLDMEVKSDSIRFDFSRSSPHCRGPLNSVLSATTSAVYVAIKHAFPQIPMNAGCFEPLDIIVPESTFLNAHYPRPVSGCAAEVSMRVCDVVSGAIAQAIPDRAPACTYGTANNLTMGGYDPKEGKQYVFYFYTGGGYGGHPAGDGLSNGPGTVGLAKTPPIEVVEQQTPIVFEEYALRPDSCGPGQFRGGLGIRYTFRVARGETRLSLLADRGKRGPFGVNGGGSAAFNRVHMVRSGELYKPELITKDENLPLQPGDTVCIETPGGGGYGPSALRSPAAIETDLRRGYITPEYAARHFGWKGGERTK